MPLYVVTYDLANRKGKTLADYDTLDGILEESGNGKSEIEGRDIADSSWFIKSLISDANSLSTAIQNRSGVIKPGDALIVAKVDTRPMSKNISVYHPQASSLISWLKKDRAKFNF